MFVAAESCGNCLKNLELQNAFKKLRSPPSSPRLFEALSQMSALTQLSIDYHVLSDELMLAISNTTRNLCRMNIFASASNSWHASIRDSVWSTLKNSCQQLRVFFKVGNNIRFRLN